MMFICSKILILCLASLRLSSLATATDIHDVVIVGAGWSGLAAANYLMEAGITDNFLILEARDRIGGRSFTKEDIFKTGHPVELGSGWIYPDTNVFNLVQELGIEHDTTHYSFDTLGLFNSTGELSDYEKSLVVDQTYLEDFVTYANRMVGYDVTWTDIKESYFAENYELTNSDKQAINALVHAGITIEFGGPLNETNSETTADYLGRGDWRDIEIMSVAGGTGGGYNGAMTRGLANSFGRKIKTNTPVVKISQDTEVVEIYTADGQVIYARSVIVTVPLGVLKKSAIEFVPPLSNEKLEAIDLIGMGNMNKVLMYWDNSTQNISWWPEGKIDMQLITDQDADSEDWTYFYNEQSHAANKDYHVLSSWCGGDACDRLEMNSDEETIAMVLGNLRKMFGEIVPAPSKYIVTRWRSEEFSGGAYSFDVAGFDLTSYRRTLSQPTGNIFFAGEATDTDGWFATAVGAYTTGVRAASEIDSSGILEMPPPEFQPTCKKMHESCGGPSDEACCGGLTCVVDTRTTPTPISSPLGDIKVSRSIRRICSPAQRKKRERNRLSLGQFRYRASRSSGSN